MGEGKVLIIDNQIEFSQKLTAFLKEQGYIPSVYQEIKKALDAFLKEEFDVVMVELGMPQMDGIEIIEEIKKVDPESITIAMITHPSLETVQKAIRAGAFDYITKPFSKEEISFVMKRAFAFRNLSVGRKKLMEELEKQNVKLEQQIKEKTKELALIYQVDRDISSTLNLEEILEVILDRLCIVLNVERCSVLLLDEGKGELYIRAARGLSEDIVIQTRLKVGEPISGWVLKHKEPVFVEDIEKDPRFARRNHERYYTHSFISVPLIVKEGAIGVINVNNKKTKQPLTNDDFRIVKGIANKAAIAVENVRLYSTLEDSYIRTVTALTSAIDAKDHYTKSHSEHVSQYAVAIGREMGLSEREIEEIRQACQLHDLGKIGVHDYILTKPGKLTPEEWEEIRQHSLKSAEILKPLIFLGEAIDLIKQHHERYDGKGYPYGLKGDQIKLGARIIAVADSFDAMTTDRPYRRARTKEEAIEEIKKCSGTQFDPKVVEAFLRIVDKLPPKPKK
ncbi:MAG: response regulator [Candidatus Omnitrophica bacterium]|nr:response regulator [Candidatus Omnitrophota bacterium]